MKPGDFPLRLVSSNLQTGVSVRHTLDSIPKGSILVTGVGPWEDDAWFTLHSRFDPAGWLNDRFYINTLARQRRIAMDPLQASLRVVELPQGRLLCSDCPPTQVVAGRIGGDKRPDISDERSVAWRDGRLSEYRYEIDYKNGGVTRVSSDGQHELVVADKHRWGTMTFFGCVRVSPDEHYLAYTVMRKINFVIPLPDAAEDVYVMDLETRKEKRIGTWGYATNLIWSGDSRTLYFGGEGKVNRKSGIYVVDVAGTFRN